MSGSSLRPIRMLAAFRASGFEVDVIAGMAAERHALMERVKARIGEGIDYAFCYFETSTIPSALTEQHHIPTHGEMDLAFLAYLHKKGIPIGIFYRDAQWRLPSPGLSTIPALKRKIARVFYEREMTRISKTADIIFVPSMEFANWLNLPQASKIRALPPGCEIHHRIPRDSREYALMYIGGIDGPIYDISSFIEIAGILPLRKFLLVCRTQEWERFAAKRKIPKNIYVEHARSSELDRLYEKADLFSIVMESTEYFSIAMPVKLFDALGHGLPIIASDGTAASQFVKHEGIGWCIKSPQEAANLIEMLFSGNRKNLDAVCKVVSEVALRNTWELRARQVADELTLLKSR